MSPFEVRTTDEDGVARIEVSGELDLASAPELQRDLLAYVADPTCREIVLDLRAVTFIDSSGLRAVLVGSREATDAGRRLRVRPGTGQTLRLIELADVADRLDLELEGPATS